MRMDTLSLSLKMGLFLRGFTNTTNATTESGVSLVFSCLPQMSRTIWTNFDLPKGIIYEFIIYLYFLHKLHKQSKHFKGPKDFEHTT